MSEILSYLDSKGIQYKLSGNEAIIKCPNCGKPKLYINIDTGIYHCFRCQAREPDNPFAKGHISQLKKYWGDILPVARISDEKKGDVDFTDLAERLHLKLYDHKGALRYLAKRGFSAETIKRFKIGYRRQHDQDWISIPVYEKDKAVLIKYRKIPPIENTDISKYVREKGGKSVLFNGDILDKVNDVLVCEAELDAITLIQAGYDNVVASTSGVSALLPEWYDRLNLMDKIYLVFDNDDAGYSASKKVWARRLGYGRCYHVQLPKDVKDVNEMYVKYGDRFKDEFEKCLQNAKQFDVDGIKSIKVALREWYQRTQENGEPEKIKLPWESVNKLLGGGIESERLLVVGGVPGVGKTSFALNICYHFALEYKIPCLFFCMEMTEITLVRKIIQIHYDISEHEISADDAMVYVAELGDLPLYFGYSPKVNVNVFYETMKECRNRYGIEFGVFDNLQRMVRTGEESDIAKASGMFKDITMDLQIPFLLVSQPRKLNSLRPPTLDDLKGSGAIPADADYVILLHRSLVRGVDGVSSAFSPRTTVYVDKSRFSAGGSTTLLFLGERSRFVSEETAID